MVDETLLDHDKIMEGLPPQLQVKEDSPEWKRLPAFLAMIKHLKETDLEVLKSQGAWIPCWRIKMG